jgi:tetratricopeptide (TPR) repeat protein
MDRSKYDDLLAKAESVEKESGMDAAIECLNNFIKENRNSVEGYLVRGILFSFSEITVDSKKALKDLDKVIMLAPNTPDAYFRRGSVYAKLGNLNKAHDDYNKTIELDADYAEAYANRSYIYIEKKEFQKAVDDCTKSIELFPDEPQSYYNRGVAYFCMGELEKSLDDYNKVIELSPEYAEVYLKRGFINSELDNIQESISDLERFLELDPDNKDAKLARNALKNLKKGKKIHRKTEKNKILTAMIIGCVIGTALGGLFSGYIWLGFVIGAFLGLGLSHFWKEHFKFELTERFSAIWWMLKDSIRQDIAEKGFIKGGFFGIFIYTPLRFLLGVVMFLFWPGLKLYFLLIISPFFAIYELVKACMDEAKVKNNKRT